MHADRPDPEGHQYPRRGTRAGRRGRKCRQRFRLEGDRHLRHFRRRFRHGLGRGDRAVRGVRRRVERPARERRWRAIDRMVRRGRLGPPHHTGRGVRLRALGRAPSEQRGDRRLHRDGATPDGRAGWRPRTTRCRRRWIRSHRVRGGRPRPRRRRGARQQWVGHRQGTRHRQRGRRAVGKSALPVGGRAALRRGPAHRAGRSRRLRGSVARVTGRRHRLHRRCGLDPHGVGRQADDRVQPDARPDDADVVPRRWAVGPDDVDRRGDRHPASRWHRRHRDPHAVAQRVRPDPRLPRYRLDGHERVHLSGREHRQQRVRRAVHPDATDQERRRPPSAHGGVPGRSAVQHGGGRRRRHHLVRRHLGHAESQHRSRTGLLRQALHRPADPGRVRPWVRPARRIRQWVPVGGRRRCP